MGNQALESLINRSEIYQKCVGTSVVSDPSADVPFHPGQERFTITTKTMATHKVAPSWFAEPWSKAFSALESAKAFLVRRPEGNIAIQYIEQVLFPPDFRVMMAVVLPASESDHRGDGVYRNICRVRLHDGSISIILKKSLLNITPCDMMLMGAPCCRVGWSDIPMGRKWWPT